VEKSSSQSIYVLSDSRSSTNLPSGSTARLSRALSARDVLCEVKDFEPNEEDRAEMRAAVEGDIKAGPRELPFRRIRQKIKFNAGTHTDSLCMHYGDFADIVRPVVGSFGIPPSARRMRVPKYRARRADPAQT
jgi:hypothetical protein